jgi:hypothetical protein
MVDDPTVIRQTMRDVVRRAARVPIHVQPLCAFLLKKAEVAAASLCYGEAKVDQGEAFSRFSRRAHGISSLGSRGLRRAIQFFFIRLLHVADTVRFRNAVREIVRCAAGLAVHVELLGAVFLHKAEVVLAGFRDSAAQVDQSLHDEIPFRF